jgi:hypothetical protein
MSYVVRTADDYLKRGYERVGLPPPESEKPSWLHVLKGFSQQGKRIEICSFYPSPRDATPFPSESAAWAAFDRAAVGRRADFLVTPL